ncbi:hypothetical protein MK079_04860, partial [Candidatus Gracilibacteria bacterium]|nr:hypothetical protein [Candidatus Gracilibacteria bacterium]
MRLNKKNISKIFALSILIVLITNLGGYIMSAGSDQSNTVSGQIPSNGEKFSSVSSSHLMQTGIAIGTNIALQKSGNEANTFSQATLFSSEELLILDEEHKEDMMAYNMGLSTEYRNILRSDIKEIIQTSYNKATTIQAFLDQLEHRYTRAGDQVITLTRQRDALVQDMTSIQAKIDSLKVKINTDFSKNDAQSSTQNIEDYVELKKEFYLARTYAIYINHFISRYNSLNAYNLALADTLKNNTDALIKNAQVVIPDSGT